MLAIEPVAAQRGADLDLVGGEEFVPAIFLCSQVFRMIAPGGERFQAVEFDEGNVFTVGGGKVLVGNEARHARGNLVHPLAQRRQGLFVGAISKLYEVQFDGIVLQAVGLTVGVFVMMLVLYGLRILRATPRFVKGVIAATFGIMVVYGVMMIANLFGVGEGFWTSGSPLGIVISLVVVIIILFVIIIFIVNYSIVNFFIINFFIVIIVFRIILLFFVFLSSSLTLTITRSIIR